MSDPSSTQGDRWVERLRKAVGGFEDAVDPSTLAGLPSLSRYELRERLGEGATAVVYRGWDRELRRPVAIKVLKEFAGMSEIVRQRFRREAQAAASVSHPNIVQIHDVGEEQGRLYLVMEFVEGRALADLLREKAPGTRELAGLLEKAARGVAAAHAKGIVHRDLKPANILMTAEGEPKVADFGLAHLEDSPLQLTRTGATLGTPHYMSPEQVEGRVADISPRTDVYALGAILYEGLVGRPVHDGATPMDLYQRIVREDPAAPRGLKPGLPRDLETIALKALRREPGGRYADASDLADDLARHLAGDPIRARPMSPVEKLWRSAVRARATLLPASAVLLLAAAFLWSRFHSPTVALLESSEGEVLVLNGETFAAIAPGQALRSGQGLRTGGSASRAVLTLPDGGRMELGPETTLQGRPRRFFLTQGTVRARGRFELATAHGNAELSGGEIRVVATAVVSRLEVLDGPELPVRSAKGGVRHVLGNGQFIVLGEGQDGKPRSVEDGLIGHWTLREMDGPRVRDASGHGNDGMFASPPPRTPGRRGTVVRFDGQVGFDVPTLNGTRFPRAGTLSFWVRPEHHPAIMRGIVDVFDPGRRHLFLRTTPPGLLQVAFQGQSGYVFSRNAPLSEGNWTHVALSWRLPGTANLYLNGSLDYTAHVADSAWLPDEEFFSVGGTKLPGTAFVGAIEDLRLYDKVLPAAAVRLLAAP
jgi:predicted Ser/Thr protein kinase